MTTFLIVLIFMLGASLPLSRAILNMIKRSDRYTEEFKRKAQVWQNIYRIACFVGAIVLLLILKSSFNSAS